MATTEARAESPTCASDNSTRSSGKRSCVSGAMHHFAAALQEEASLHTRNDKHWFIIDPRTNRHLKYLDIMTSTALIFTAIVTPYEVGFIRSSNVDTLFVLNRLVDFLFLIDLVLQFVIMVPPHAGSSNTRWVDDPNSIGARYLRGWFPLDFGSILVSTFDIIAVSKPDSEDGRPAETNFKALRVLRALRLTKLVRLVRGSRIFLRWQMRLAINCKRRRSRIQAAPLRQRAHACARSTTLRRIKLRPPAQ
jgi:hypothetical protein